MRENNKKRNKIWQGLSLAVLVSILGLFFYLNVMGEDKSEQVEVEKPKTVEIQAMKVVKPIASLEWDEPEVPATISDNVYYGDPSQLDDEIILSESGLEYKKIKVVESGEEFVHFDSIQNPRIKHISAFDPNYHRYIRDGSESKYMRKGVRAALITMLDYLPQNLGIIYVEGYMSPQTYQKRLSFRFNKSLKHNSNSSQAYTEALAAVPKSSLTGGAISIAIYDIAKNEMVGLDNAHEMGQRDETFSPKTTPEHRQNRLTLLNAATKAGFVNYGMMWWYFTLNEKMSAYVNDQEKCSYGVMGYDELTAKFTPYNGSLELDLKDLITKSQTPVVEAPAVLAQEPVKPVVAKTNPV